MDGGEGFGGAQGTLWDGFGIAELFGMYFHVSIFGIG